MVESPPHLLRGAKTGGKKRQREPETNKKLVESQLGESFQRGFRDIVEPSILHYNAKDSLRIME